MGPDWNGDGNHDWRDDAFYNTVLNGDTKNDETKTPTGNGRKTNPQLQNQPQANNTKSGTLGTIVIIVIIIVLVLIFRSCG